MKKDVINGRILYKFLCVNNILNAFVANAIDYAFCRREYERKECNTIDDIINKIMKNRHLISSDFQYNETPPLIVFLEHHSPMAAFPWVNTREGVEFWKKYSDNYVIFRYDFLNKIKNYDNKFK